jgi:hypothetical protein
LSLGKKGKIALGMNLMVVVQEEMDPLVAVQGGMGEMILFGNTLTDMDFMMK